MTNPISHYYSPTSYGDWMGANGPAVPTAPGAVDDLQFIRNLGLRWVRLNTDMAWLGRPAYLPNVTGFAAEAVALGLVPLLVMSGAPDGAGGPGGQPTDAGLDSLQRSILGGLEALYGAGVRAIETQNEWDGPGVAGAVDVPRTVQAHRLVYELWHAIGARHHDATVMCMPGGTSTAAEKVTPTQAPGAFPPATGGPQPLYAPLAWKSWLAQRGGLAFDAAAHHAGAYPYNPNDPSEVNQPYNGLYNTPKIAAEVQALHPGARTFVTEIPWPDDQLGGEQAAAARATQDLGHLLDWVHQGQVGPVIVYHGCRDGAPGHDPSAKFGIRRADGTPKPVCDALRHFATASFTVKP